MWKADVQDTEEVAAALQASSSGAIKVSCAVYELSRNAKLTVQTGVYHASIDDSEKEMIHTRWRQGKIK